ncbi:MAG: hypothetical protein ACK58N_00530 [Synechocystis sp.]|jgi:lysophospholipase L1-like esterase
MRNSYSLLRQDNPDVVIVIGEPFQPWQPFPAIALAYQQIATQLSTERSPIVTVKTQTDWISDPDQAGTCTVDWVHPNEKGDKMIAEAFYQGIKPYWKFLARAADSKAKNSLTP